MSAYIARIESAFATCWRAICVAWSAGAGWRRRKNRRTKKYATTIPTAMAGMTHGPRVLAVATGRGAVIAVTAVPRSGAEKNKAGDLAVPGLGESLGYFASISLAGTHAPLPLAPAGSTL